MKELKIVLPPYERRGTDADTLAMLALKYDLDYDASVIPFMTVSDEATKEVILRSEGEMHCYVSGDDDKVEEFLKELKSWITDF